ncbi:MAG: hypothetical protein QXU21_03005 [Candidatus Bathyarchaeia archaeon]
MAEIGQPPREKIAVLLIFIFSIFYRILLLRLDAYPPGPDLGLHNSIINSITLKNGNFSWNYYHMGGETSLTHPGFHIFTSFILLTTGMPDYAAQSIVSVLFSSLIVLCAFLLTKSAWGLPMAPLIAAFMAALSRHDLEMLLWGGYPNVVTLVIISLIFYMLLRKDTLASTLLVVSTLLIGGLLLTHALSSLVFLCIALPFIVLELAIFRKSHENKKKVYLFALSILLGFLVASPFLVEVFPLYLENVDKGMFTGGISENKVATILTRKVPVELVLASLIPTISFFIFAKKYKGAFFDRASVLFGLWLLVPAFSTQAYVVGLYTDYYRLLHFLIMPLIIFLAIFTDHGLNFLVKVVGKITQQRKVKINLQTIYCLSTAAILILFSFSLIPFFAGPQEGFTIANYYDVVSSPEFESIQWIRQVTSANSIFVSQHGYGWWISGFGQRATLSATDPQFLIIPQEFEAAYVARTLLDTDFVLNNGLIEIREDGGYVGRHNPMLLINSTRFPDPYPILYFNESETIMFYRDEANAKIVDATTIPVKEIKVETQPHSAYVTIIRQNNQLILTRRIEISKSLRFGIISLTVESVGTGIGLDHVRIMLHANGKILQLGQSVGILDDNAKICGQVIFEGKPPITKFLAPENPCLELFYSAENAKKMEISMIAGGFEVEKMDIKNIQILLANMTKMWFIKEENAERSINVFDYREILRQKEISFIAFKRREYPVAKFLNDPIFNLVFINDNVVIFKVRRIHG